MTKGTLGGPEEALTLPLPTCGHCPFSFIAPPPATPFNSLGYPSFPSYEPPPTIQIFRWLAGRGKGQGKAKGTGLTLSAPGVTNEAELGSGSRIKEWHASSSWGAAAQAHLGHEVTNVAQVRLCQRFPEKASGVPDTPPGEHGRIVQKCCAAGKHKCMCVGPAPVGD